MLNIYFYIARMYLLAVLSLEGGSMKRLFHSLSLLLLLGIISCVGKAPHSAKVVDLTASDGIKLKASYFPAGKPGPGVLLLHQCDHDRKIWDGLAQQLARAGINVVTMDLRGFGESGGRPHNPVSAPGPIEPAEEMQMWPGDVDVAYQYLKSRPEVKPDQIGIGGGSCGVNNSIHTAMRHPEVKSLVLLAGPADLKAREFLRQSKLPMFFAVADDDQYPFMVQLIELFYSISGSPAKKFVHYQTGRHAAEIFSVHPELQTAIVDWYVTTLIKTPGSASATADAPEIPAEVHIMDLIDQLGGPESLQKTLLAAREKDPKAPFISEEAIESFAAEYLQAGDVKRSLEILKLDATAYPKSPNVYDCFAQVYLAAGQKALARQNTRKALALLRSDTTDPPAFRDSIKASAAQRLKQLDAAH